MTVIIGQDKSPYRERTPFDVLGIPRSATARQITDAYEERLDDINADVRDDAERIARIAELDAANDELGEAKRRAVVELFIFDPTLGREECTRNAKKYEQLSFDFDRILERADDMLPSRPDVSDARGDFRPVSLEQALVADAEPYPFAQTPEEESLAALEWDL